MTTLSPFDFSLPNIDGRPVSLADYPEAKGFIIIFTCNHCPYAIAYEQRIEALHKEYAPLGFPLIAISSNDPISYPQDSPENMKIRARERGFSFPYLHDATQEVARKYGAERTPHAYILLRTAAGLQGVYKGAIDDNYQYPARVQQHYLAEKIRDLLQNKADAYEETSAVGCSIKWKQA